MGADFRSNPASMFIIGRQHSGNTMLGTMLGRHSDVRAFCGEGTFFENLPSLQRLENSVALINEVVDEFSKAASLEEGERERVRQYLRNTTKEGTPLEYYLLGKSFLANQKGASRWVQKATSYIFHVPLIREHVPSARFVYLVRNPLDLAASLKRRGGKEGWGRMLWGWRRGLRRAQSFAKNDPQTFLVVRYEDLVRNGEETFREICEFCGLKYEEACLNIPHVNRAETPYNRESEQKGLSGDRVFYFGDVLSSSEAAAVEWMAGASRIQAFYPQLEEVGRPGRLEVGASLAGILGQGILHLVADQANVLFRNPQRGGYRIWKRLFG